MPSSSGSLVIAMKPNTNYRFHAADMFVVLHSKKTLAKVPCISNIYHHTSFEYSILSVASTWTDSQPRYPPTSSAEYSTVTFGPI